MADVIRDVLVRVSMEMTASNLHMPEMGGFVEQQKQVKESTEAASYELHREDYALQEVQTSTVAAAAATEQHTESVKAASHAHGSMYHSLHALARPINQVMHGFMHLAHSVAMMTAANEEDEKAMARSLLKYESAIMLISGLTHTIPALVLGYEMLTGAATAAAVAQAAALAPLAIGIAVAAAAAVSIYALGDAFDVWGRHAKMAKAEAESAIHAMEEAARAAKQFDQALAGKEAEAADKRFGIRVKTDPNFDAQEQLKEHVQERAALEADMINKKARAAAEETRHVHELKEHAKEIHGTKGSFWEFDSGSKANVKAHAAAEGADVTAKHIEQLEAEKLTLEGLEKAEDRIQAIREKEIEDLQHIGEHLRSNLKIQQDTIKAASDALETADRAKDSGAEHYGRMHASDRQRLAHLEQTPIDQLTDEQLKDLEGLQGPGGSEKIKEEYKRRGEKAGYGKTVVGQRQQDDIDVAESQYGNANMVGNNREGHNAHQLETEIKKKEDELRAAGDSALKGVDRMVKEFTKFLKKVEALANEHERVNNEKKAAGG